MPRIRELHAAHGDRAAFLLVYIREAHPTDEWRMESNDRDGFALAQPVTTEERVAAAADFVARVGVPFPVLVDAIDDAVSVPYGGWPERAYVLDADGRILYQGEVGPYGFRLEEVEAVLRRLR